MLLDIRNLTKTYGAPDGGDAVNVLRGVDLKMQAGETLSIIGPSGSGKSTVLNIVGALDKADAGQVIVNGQSVERLNKDELAAYRSTTVGFIFQLHHLLPQCTILENVLVPTLAVPKAKREAARGIDPLDVREVPIHLGVNTGINLAAPKSENPKAKLREAA